MTSKSPFDDASGAQLIPFLIQAGGSPLPVNADVEATGTTLATAAQLQPGITLVNGGNGTKGVRLPNETLIGQSVKLSNEGEGTLKVWPPDASQHIGLLPDGLAYNGISASAYITFYRLSPTAWKVL